MNTRWDQLKAWLVTKIPDNILGLIRPRDVREAFGELMDSFEVMLQYKIPAGKRRFITVTNPGQRSWPLSVNSSQSFISTFAITSKSRRILFQDVHFTVTGAGKDRTLAIIDPFFDDFLGDERLCFEEYGVGEKIEFIQPVFGYSEVNGVKQISWKLSNENDDAYRPFAAAPSPYRSSDVLFNHPQLGQINVAAALQELLDRQDIVVYTPAEFTAAQDHPYPRQIIYMDIGIYYKIPGYPIIKLLTFRPTTQS